MRRDRGAAFRQASRLERARSAWPDGPRHPGLEPCAEFGYHLLHVSRRSPQRFFMHTAVRRISLVATLTLLAASAAAQPAPKGKLVVVGGGTIPPVILDAAVRLAGGPSAIVAILPQASELADTGARTATMWKQAGVSRAIVVDVKNGQAAERAIGEATLIWIPGGDQSRLMAAVKGTRLPTLVGRRYAEGAIVGGTSAGAAVMSKVMVTGDADLQSITAGRTETIEGLGLWPEVVVDQHFLKRQRAARLISLILDKPDLVGVGIDESTAVVVTGRRFEVIGLSSVVVVDARAAQVEARPVKSLAAGRNLRLHVLTSGMTFDLDER